MRKAEELAEVYFNTCHMKVEEIIKQAQEEAIHETVKRCAESARMVEVRISDSQTGTTFRSDSHVGHFVDKDSILLVESELLNQLNKKR